MVNTHDWSINKPEKAYFEKDLNCMIDCVKAKNFSEIVILTIEFYIRKRLQFLSPYENQV